MVILPLNAIQIPPNRQRQTFDDSSLEELINSIKEVGLLHPIVIKEGAELVAGERRFRAISVLAMMGQTYRFNGETLPEGHIPCVDIGDVSPSEQYQAELDENLRRADLTWQERAQAIARLASLQEAAGVSPAAAIQAIAKDLAPEADRLATEHLTRQSVILASHLNDPDIAKAKTQRDAFKVLKAKTLATQNAALALEVGKESTSDRHTLIHGDCVEWLKAYTGPKFDVLLTDPPYGMNADAFGDAAGQRVALTHDYDDSPEYALSVTEAMLAAVEPHLKEEAHLYLYCDIDRFHNLREMVKHYGWTPHRTPLVHIKREGGRVPWPTSGPRRAYELVLYAQRGSKPVTAIVPDVFDTSSVGGNLGHGAQKPVEAFRNLLARSCRPGDRVVDPFGGTGTTFLAAEVLGCRSVVIEKEASFYGIAVKRLEELRHAG